MTPRVFRQRGVQPSLPDEDDRLTVSCARGAGSTTQAADQLVAQQSTGLRKRSDPPQSRHFATFRPISRGILWNFVGSGIPILLALISIPVLIHRIGCDRFGLLTIAWALMNYASMFTLGLGRTTTKELVDALGRDREGVGGILWSSLAAHLGLGVLGALAFGFLARPVAEVWLSLDAALGSEAVWASLWLASSVPIVLGSLFLRAALEGVHRFDLINLSQFPSSVFTYLGPLLVLPWTSSLAWIVFVVVVGRLITMVALLAAVLRQWPEMRAYCQPRWAIVGPMLRPGLWMTATSLVPLLLAATDRLLVGRFVSAEAVAHYATPYEMVTKLWIISASVLSVLFPSFTQLFACDRAAGTALFWRTVKVLTLVSAPCAAILLVAGHDVLAGWISAEFADSSAPVLRWLTVGVAINIIAQVPSTYLQSIGRGEIAGRTHLAECAIYLAVSWVFAAQWGLVGMAVAWTLRAAIDAALMFALVSPYLRFQVTDAFREYAG